MSPGTGAHHAPHTQKGVTVPKRLWNLLHEPRVITAIIAVTWLLVLAAGINALVDPPATFTTRFDASIAITWPIAFVVGGVLGFAGSLPGWWWIERGAIIAAGTGLGAYVLMVLTLHYSSPMGNRVPQALIMLALLGHLVNRWIRVRGAQVDPTRGVRP